MDRTIQKAIYYLTTDGEVKWNDFPSVGVDNHYYLWYYAENRQYVIRDVMTDTFFFVKARSPKEAYEIYRDRWDEAMKAGAWVDEDGGGT